MDSSQVSSYKVRPLQNRAGLDYADKLRKEGHRCIRYIESYPVQLSWCQRTPCKNITK
jgi:hypothetical protein